MKRAAVVVELAAVFLELGVSSFGGPIAHLGYLRTECVDRRRWLDDESYGDLVALCQLLPGPTSSQVVFALGMLRAGLVGAIVASTGFLLPSAIAMISFAYGLAALGDLRHHRWLHGLMLAAVAVVAQAVYTLAAKLCAERTRATLALAAAVVSLALPSAATQVGVIAVASLVGWRLLRDSDPATPPDVDAPMGGRAAALCALVAFFLLLVAPRLSGLAEASRAVALFDAFYRSGALVFGGGHVVLPLLRASIVPRGWLGDQAFLAGYGAAQAMPGPLFSFAGYLGAAITRGPNAWLGGVSCLIAMFLPGWLLVAAALPFWRTLRAMPSCRGAFHGANAAVVGVLGAALYTPVFTESVLTPRDLAIAITAFGLLEHWRVPPWIVVALSALVAPWATAA